MERRTNVIFSGSRRAIAPHTFLRKRIIYDAICYYYGRRHHHRRHRRCSSAVKLRRSRAAILRSIDEYIVECAHTRNDKH